MLLVLERLKTKPTLTYTYKFKIKAGIKFPIRLCAKIFFFHCLQHRIQKREKFLCVYIAARYLKSAGVPKLRRYIYKFQR